MKKTTKIKEIELREGKGEITDACIVQVSLNADRKLETVTHHGTHDDMTVTKHGHIIQIKRGKEVLRLYPTIWDDAKLDAALRAAEDDAMEILKKRNTIEGPTSLEKKLAKLGYS